MPVEWRKSEENYSIVVWKSIEPIEMLFENASLNKNELSIWQSFKSNTRKREWLTVRNALKVLLPDSNGSSIYYDGNGKPYLNESGLISISHSHDNVAVMFAKQNTIGVDIENIHERILVLSKKFLNETEKRDFDNSSLEKLHVAWGAKEVLYKIHSIGGVDFKKDLMVHPFEYCEAGSLIASITKQGFEEDFEIYYSKLDEFMLTWAMRR